MAFQLSDTVNKDKFFLVKRSELEGRIDCEYYRPERKIFFTRLRSNNFVDKLMNAIEDGSYGVLPPGDCYEDCHPVKFLRATDLKPDLNLSFESYKKVPQKYFDNHKRARLRKNDILLAVKGATIASNKCVAYLPNHIENAIVNGSIFRFQCKELYLPEFIAFMLELPSTKKQMKYNLVANNAVDYVDKSLINNLLIFLPPIDVQKRILSMMNVVYAEKKQKEAQAHEILNSIDTYLLNQLGIDLPPEEENTISQRMFVRKFSEVSGGRFDVYFYKMKFIELTHKICDSKYTAVQLGKVCDTITNGFDNRDFSLTGLPYVKVANIRPYQITPDIFQCINIDTPGRVSLAENDILLTRKGSFGMAARVTNFIDYAICSEIFKIRLNDVKNAPYIEALLNSRICQIQFDQLKIGAIMGSLTQDVIMKVLIPLPPPEKQNEIAAHIQSIRDQAKQLKTEAAAGLEQAKRQVEAMIFGQD